MDESVLRNLDTQHRRLAALEAEVERLLADAPATPVAPTGDELLGTIASAPALPGTDPPAPAVPLGYAELTAANDALRAEAGWHDLDLDAALGPELAVRRRAWGGDDVVAVAVAGLVGVAATWFDTSIDGVVRDRLAELSQTELIQRWERDAKRMPIDYMGRGFGGRLHRVRSAGHDIGRPFEALRQIREGEFRGFAWVDGERFERLAGHYRPVASLGEALTLWGKHLVADVVTPTSLPLPGWSKLYELPSRDLRIFAHHSYGNGANLRSLAVSTLPVVTTELLVRAHVHGRALAERGTVVLLPAEEALRSELLLAAHSVVGAVALGKALAVSLATSPALGFRHVNWPVLLRAAALGLQVARDARASRAALTWDDLLAHCAQPWQLDTAAELDGALAAA